MSVKAPTLAVEALNARGEKLGDFKLDDVAYEPAIQWAHFAGVKQGLITPVLVPAAAEIIPVACSERGLPYIEGFEVRFAGQSRGMKFGNDLLHNDVLRNSSALIEQGRLQAGEQFTYRICSFAPGSEIDSRRSNTSPETSDHSEDFSLLPSVEVLNIRDDLLPESSHSVGGPWDDDDLPIVIPQHVLDEAVLLAASAAEKESGGLLLGQLCRDVDTLQLFLEITAFMPAPHARGTETSLHLGPDTFAAVEKLLALRNCNEQTVGWLHSHPWFCRNCPVEQRQHCALREPFFSEADRNVHRTLFPQAFSPAVLITDLGEGRTSIDVFGWRRGLIESRGFLKPAPAALSRPQSASKARTDQENF